MRTFFWIDGRLSWPLVVTIAYSTAALIVFDYIWRVTVLPFSTLVFYVLVPIGLLPISVFGLHLCICWWSRQDR